MSDAILELSFDEALKEIVRLEAEVARLRKGHDDLHRQISEQVQATNDAQAVKTELVVKMARLETENARLRRIMGIFDREDV